MLVDLSVRQGQEPEKFFVSAGFALTHPTSVTDITAIEAVRVEELDEGAVSVLPLVTFSFFTNEAEHAIFFFSKISLGIQHSGTAVFVGFRFLK